MLATVVGTGALPAPAGDSKLEALEEQAFKQAAALANPSVVRIQTVGGLDRVGSVRTGTGPTTGVVVSNDGYIISSAFHFISKPASTLIELADGRRFPARMVATDHSRMLTLLKIEANDLVPVQAAAKESFRVGQWAIALGRTYNKAFPSMSVGIVSALGRIWGRAIQTDAKISPVNYGGPLVDIYGKVLGVLVPLSPGSGSETAGVEWYDSGIGFAIPTEDVYASLARLKTGKDLHPGLMGINLGSNDALGGKPVIGRVRVESPADKAGLKPNDVIVEVDGKKVNRVAEVRHALGNKYAGDKITLSVERGKDVLRKELTLVAKLLPYESGFLGILPIREASGRAVPPGVGVRYVFADSPAAKLGLKTRDRILRFNDTEVNDAETLTDLVSRLRPSQKATVLYVRDGVEKTIEVQLASLPDAVPKELRSVAIPPPAKAPEAGKKDEANEKDTGEKETKNEENDRPKTGRFTQNMPAHEHSYWAYVPDDYNPAHRYGLLVWIHPGGDTMEAAILKQWKAVCEQRGIMILAPKAANIAGWDLGEANFVKDAVGQFMEKYSIDRSRVWLHSFSSGGGFAYHLAFKHRDLLRGVAVVASPLRTGAPENDPDFRLQFHLVCGEGDKLLGGVRATVTQLRRLKYPVSFTLVKGHRHKYPPADDVHEIGRWADCLDRI